MSCCESDHTALKSYEDAVAQLLAAARPIADVETLPLAESLGRILARPVRSAIDVPPWDYSAMDGYAIHVADFPVPGTIVPVSQRIPAGTAPLPLKPGTAARIFTGSPIPPGADTVVVQEVCEPVDDGVRVLEVPKPGANIRRTGEDIGHGSEIITAGTALRPQHLGLAASVGIATLDVVRRPRVAFFSTGDELVMPGQPLAPGKIYNSNLYTATGLLQALGCEVVSLGIVEDSFEATCAALDKGARSADLVLASGGVSVGEEDHVKPAVEKLGRLELWKIAIRPGKPLAFGHIHGTPFFGTPGNPVSLFVTFLLFARPFIRKMQGCGETPPMKVAARAAFDWPRPDKRREYVRARLYRGENGELWAEPFPSRSSGVLSSVTASNALAVVPEATALRRGDRIDCIPFCEVDA